MNNETIKSLSKIGELVGEEKHDPRQKFMRVKDACAVYHMSRPKIIDEALNAGALYRLRREEGAKLGVILIKRVQKTSRS